MGYFLLFYPPNSPKNQNFKKMKKTPEDIILHMCTKNYDQMVYRSWDMVCNRWTNGQTEKNIHIEVGTPPKNIYKCRAYLDLYYVWLSNAAPFCKNYAKLHFDAKHLEKWLIRGEMWWWNVGALFSKKASFFIKKCPFWPISNAALNF